MKRLLLFVLLTSFAFGQTKPFVPRADNEGAIGLPTLDWGFGYFRGLHSDTTFANTVRISGTVDESVILSLTGTPHALVIRRTDAGNVHMSWNNPATGSALGDGLDMGIETNGTARIRQQENLPLEFYTNNTEAWSILANHSLVSGTDGTPANNITTAGTITGATLMIGSNAAVSTIDSRLSDARTPLSHSHTESDITNLVTDLSGKQATLVSGTNIKTVNGNSLLGSGDVVIGGSAAWGSITGTLSSQTDLNTALSGKASTAHATTHVTGGSDIIANAVAAGNSGLMTGTDKTKLDAITGTNTGDNAANSSSMFIGTTSHALNRGSGAETIAGLTLTTPVIGAATGTSLAVTGAVTSSGAGIGYVTGAGGTVTQATSRTTGVTLSKLSGTITMFSSAVAAAASSTFTWTNTFIAATDIVIMQHNSSTNACSWKCEVICAAGTATVVVKNISAASITEATPLKFVVIKASNN